MGMSANAGGGMNGGLYDPEAPTATGFFGGHPSSSASFDEQSDLFLRIYKY
jgi:hypothetical protein